MLNLSNNLLQSIEFSFSHMKHLQTFDLSYIRLTDFGLDIQKELDIVRVESQNLILNLSENPLQCTCESLNFIHWMYDRRTMFGNFENYTCSHNNSLVQFKNLKELIDALNFDCSTKLVLKVSASLLGLVIIIVAVSVLIYRYRWDIRFLCIKFTVKRNTYDELEDAEKEYEYDAFVAYHKDDINWIRDELYENLDKKDNEDEDPTRFRLCIHDRDFLPGAPIEENIIKAIEKES